MKIINSRNNACLANNAIIAKSFVQKTQGLIGKPKLKLGEALYIPYCRSIHMFFMKYSIDVIFIDKNFIITKIVNELAPNTICFGTLFSYGVIELPTGSLKNNYKIGDKLFFKRRCILENKKSSVKPAETMLYNNKENIFNDLEKIKQGNFVINENIFSQGDKNENENTNQSLDYQNFINYLTLLCKSAYNKIIIKIKKFNNILNNNLVLKNLKLLPLLVTLIFILIFSYSEVNSFYIAQSQAKRLKSYIIISNTFINSQLWDKALMNLNKALEIKPNNSQIINKIQNVKEEKQMLMLYNEALDLINKEKKFKSALAILNQINENSVYYSKAIKKIQTIYDNKKSIDKNASDAIKESITSYIQGDYEKALKELSSLIEMESDLLDIKYKAKAINLNENILSIMDSYDAGLKAYKKEDYSNSFLKWSNCIEKDKDIVKEMKSHLIIHISKFMSDRLDYMSIQSYKSGDAIDARNLCLKAMKASSDNKKCYNIVLNNKK